MALTRYFICGIVDLPIDVCLDRHEKAQPTWGLFREGRNMHEMEVRLHAIAARRWRIAIWLSVFMLIVYYGFILLVAFDKPLLATTIATITTATGVTPGLSLGILLGALVIVFAWVLTMVYVYWANTKYDHEILELAHLRG
jgi:uncharacterized membrane protein (DUF485 family)